MSAYSLSLATNPLTPLQREDLIRIILSEAVLLSIQKSNINNLLNLYNNSCREVDQYSDIGPKEKMSNKHIFTI